MSVRIELAAVERLGPDLVRPKRKPHETLSGLHRHGTGLVSTSCVVRDFGTCGSSTIALTFSSARSHSVIGFASGAAMHELSLRCAQIPRRDLASRNGPAQAYDLKRRSASEYASSLWTLRQRVAATPCSRGDDPSPSCR